MDAPMLSTGCLVDILNGLNPPNPVVQMVDIKLLETHDGAPPRQRVVLSDGAHYYQAMLAPHAAEASTQPLVKDIIIRLTDYMLEAVGSRRVLFVMGVQPLGVYPRVGTPTRLDENVLKSVSTASAAAAASVPPPRPAYQSAAAPPPPTSSYGGSASGPVQRVSQQAVVPIHSLTLYSTRWTIKGRVTNKGQVRTWTNERGTGRLFSFDVVDNYGGEIRLTCFKDAVDKFEPLIQVNNVYIISGGAIKHANAKFNSTRNEYEITLDERQSTIDLVAEDTSIPQMHFKRVPLEQLRQCGVDTTVDVVGVITEIGERNNITSKKTGKDFSKRNITLVDDTLKSVTLTVWGDRADAFEGHVSDILLCKGAKVSDFGGRSLSSMMSSQVLINAPNDDVYRLRAWYDSAGRHESFSPVGEGMASSFGGQGGPRTTPHKMLLQIDREQLGFGEKPDYIMSRVWVMYMKTDGMMYYPACTQCKRKVTQSGESWTCENCATTSPTCTYRYIISVLTADASAVKWMTFFDDQAQKLLNTPASEVAECDLQGNPAGKKAIADEALFQQLNVKLRVKAEDVNGEKRVKAVAVEHSPVDFISESRRLLQELKAYA